MVVRLALVIPVQRKQPWVGLISEGFATHGAEVKMEAVQKEVNFDPGHRGLWTHSGSRTHDESGVYHFAAGFMLSGRKGSFNAKSVTSILTLR